MRSRNEAENSGKKNRYTREQLLGFAQSNLKYSPYLRGIEDAIKTPPLPEDITMEELACEFDRYLLWNGKNLFDEFYRITGQVKELEVAEFEILFNIMIGARKPDEIDFCVKILFAKPLDEEHEVYKAYKEVFVSKTCKENEYFSSALLQQFLSSYNQKMWYFLNNYLQSNISTEQSQIKRRGNSSLVKPPSNDSFRANLIHDHTKSVIHGEVTYTKVSMHDHDTLKNIGSIPVLSTVRFKMDKEQFILDYAESQNGFVDTMLRCELVNETDLKERYCNKEINTVIAVLEGKIACAALTDQLRAEIRIALKNIHIFLSVPEYEIDIEKLKRLGWQVIRVIENNEPEDKKIALIKKNTTPNYLKNTCLKSFAEKYPHSEKAILAGVIAVAAIILACTIVTWGAGFPAFFAAGAAVGAYMSIGLLAADGIAFGVAIGGIILGSALIGGGLSWLTSKTTQCFKAMSTCHIMESLSRRSGRSTSESKKTPQLKNEVKKTKEPQKQIENHCYPEPSVTSAPPFKFKNS